MSGKCIARQTSKHILITHDIQQDSYNKYFLQIKANPMIKIVQNKCLNNNTISPEPIATISIFNNKPVKHGKYIPFNTIMRIVLKWCISAEYVLLSAAHNHILEEGHFGSTWKGVKEQNNTAIVRLWSFSDH